MLFIIFLYCFALLGLRKAHKDNIELAKAQELNLTVLSFPEFIYQHSRHKQRIIVAGSHGKTTITSMIMHVLKFYNREFDKNSLQKLLDLGVQWFVTDGPEGFYKSLCVAQTELNYDNHSAHETHEKTRNGY